MSEPGVMICFRVTPDRGPDAPSERFPCADCAAPVWLSLGSKRVVAARDLAIICIECARARGLHRAGDRLPAPQPEQLPEILDALIQESQRDVGNRAEDN